MDPIGTLHEVVAYKPEELELNTGMDLAHAHGLSQTAFRVVDMLSTSFMVLSESGKESTCK